MAAYCVTVTVAFHMAVDFAGRSDGYGGVHRPVQQQLHGNTHHVWPVHAVENFPEAGMETLDILGHIISCGDGGYHLVSGLPGRRHFFVHPLAHGTLH